MELCTEMKLVGDTYGSGFGCGLTLTGSATIKGFEKVGEDPSSLRYENGKGLALTVHKRQEQDALRVWTEFANHSDEAVTLEMLASFALQDVEADAIYREEIAAAGEDKNINQYFAVLTNTRSVGVMGDGRTYDYTLALRAVTTSDFMTADWARIPYEVLDKISVRIVNEVPHINRIVYDITSKPPATIEWE